MYKLLIRPVLFLFDPEAIHHFTFSILRVAGYIPGMRMLLSAIFRYRHKALEQTLFGITFKNPVGLAAGFDKDARLVDELGAFGFGFVEIGTLTPKAQPGNDKPRLFRLPQDKAIVNRMGFNNGGASAAARRLQGRRSSVVVGGNIGKNKVTSNEEALHDYAMCVDALDAVVDYFVVNVSSPNTPGLRELQEKEPLRKLLASVKQRTQAKPHPKPVLLKIAPDLTQSQLDDVVEILQATGVDGIIATNTTISREGLVTDAEKINQIGAGGVSGAPLTKRSTEIIAYLRGKLGPGFPIVAVGGIMTPEDAVEKINAGANLLQLYTGFIYEGPVLVKRINKALVSRFH